MKSKILIIVAAVVTIIVADYFIATFTHNTRTDYLLPEKATNVKVLGNKWHQFTLDVEGDKCTFIMNGAGNLLLVRVDEPAEPEKNKEDQ